MAPTASKLWRCVADNVCDATLFIDSAARKLLCVLRECRFVSRIANSGCVVYRLDMNLEHGAHGMPEALPTLKRQNNVDNALIDWVFGISTNGWQSFPKMDAA